MYEFYKENADSVNAFIIVILLCACGIWLTYDYHRNEPIYNDTDNAMERIEERIKSIESRLDSLSARLDTAQKTLTDLGGRINTGAELAKEGVYTDVNDRILQVKCNDGNSTLQKLCRVLCL